MRRKEAKSHVDERRHVVLVGLGTAVGWGEEPRTSLSPGMLL